MTSNTDPRNAPLQPPHALDRRTLLARTFGAATAGALLGARADLTAGAAAQAPGGMPGVALPQGMRVVVTGHDAEGRSYIVRDERVATDAAFPNLFSTTGDDAFGPGPDPCRGRCIRPIRRGSSPTSAAPTSTSWRCRRPRPTRPPAGIGPRRST